MQHGLHRRRPHLHRVWCWWVPCMLRHDHPQVQAVPETPCCRKPPISDDIYEDVSGTSVEKVTNCRPQERCFFLLSRGFLYIITIISRGVNVNYLNLNNLELRPPLFCILLSLCSAFHICFATCAGLPFLIVARG